MTAPDHDVNTEPRRIEVESANIILRNVRLRSDVLIDEIELDGKSVNVTAPDSDNSKPKISTGEICFRAMISEVNLSSLLLTNLPDNIPLKDVSFQLLTGKVRINGQISKGFVHFPASVDAVLEIENGIRIKVDVKVSVLGFSLVSVISEFIEGKINAHIPLDLSKLPIPVRLDEIRCEPGRLTVLGRMQIKLPVVQASLEAPFSVPGSIEA